MNARKKLEADMALQAARTQKVKEASTETLNAFVESIAESFRTFAPFSTGSGREGNTVYLVDLERRTHFTLKSKKLTWSMAPCFVNGEAHFLAVGGDDGEGVEIWDIQKQTSSRILEADERYITALASSNNILAAGSRLKTLYLWDVRSWELFHSLEAGSDPQSVHLTSDAKYVTIGGYDGERCAVLLIQ